LQQRKYSINLVFQKKVLHDYSWHCFEVLYLVFARKGLEDRSKVVQGRLDDLGSGVVNPGLLRAF
jgi:hypothetical protein